MPLHLSEGNSTFLNVLAWDGTMQLILTRIIYLLKCLKCLTSNHFVKLKKHPFHSMTLQSCQKWPLKVKALQYFTIPLRAARRGLNNVCTVMSLSGPIAHARKRGRQCLATVWAEAMLRPWAGQSWVTKSMFSMTEFNSQQYRADD